MPRMRFIPHQNRRPASRGPLSVRPTSTIAKLKIAIRARNPAERMEHMYARHVEMITGPHAPIELKRKALWERLQVRSGENFLPSMREYLARAKKEYAAAEAELINAYERAEKQIRTYRSILARKKGFPRKYLERTRKEMESIKVWMNTFNRMVLAYDEQSVMASNCLSLMEGYEKQFQQGKWPMGEQESLLHAIAFSMLGKDDFRRLLRDSVQEKLH